MLNILSFSLLNCYIFLHLKYALIQLWKVSLNQSRLSENMRAEVNDIESQLLELAQYLSNKHINIFIEAKTHQSGKFQAFKAINLEEIGEKADLAIVVGGDGTMLGVARSLVNFDIPLIGINQGRFGFLADLNTSNMFESIDEIFQGSSYKDKRMLLQSKIFRDSKCIHEALALNDVVVRSGSRLIELEVSINGSFVHKQRSDGLVVTTPPSFLCPNAKDKASMRIDFPAPVSPVNAEKPDLKSITIIY